MNCNTLPISSLAGESGESGEGVGDEMRCNQIISDSVDIEMNVIKPCKNDERKQH